MQHHIPTVRESKLKSQQMDKLSCFTGLALRPLSTVFYYLILAKLTLKDRASNIK